MMGSAAVRRADGNRRLGMAVFLGTWVMLFAALFLACAVVRIQAAAWPPPSLPRLPRGLPGVATILLVTSSLALRARLALPRGLVMAMALGVLFVVLQASVWRTALTAGLTPGSGTYASVFFALTIFHALHVGCGLILLVVVAVRARSGRIALHSGALWLATTFWDFVTVVWVIIYGAVFWL